MSTTFLRDLRYGARQLRMSPGFAAVAILSLGLGIGANSAIFQLFDAVRLRMLPVARPSELAAIFIAGGTGGRGISNGNFSDLTNPLWEQIREHQQVFSGVFAWGGDQTAFGRPSENRSVRSLWLSGDAFAVLGVPPARGRLLDATDDRRGCAARAVISHGFWQSEFGGRDSAIGSTLLLAGTPFEVIGVTPEPFFGLEVGRSFDVAMPICAQGATGNQAYALDRLDVWWLSVFGRLKPGVTMERASAQLAAISPGVFDATARADYGEKQQKEYRALRLTASPAAQGVSSLRERYDRSLWLLLGMTGLVLLIACANLANEINPVCCKP